MDKIYNIKEILVEEIIEETINKLRALKSAPNPGNVRDCFCTVYQDDVELNSGCDNIVTSIKQAYKNSLKSIRVTIDCKPSPSPIMEPTPMRRGWQ